MAKYRWQRDLPAGYKQAYFLGNEISTNINWQFLRERAKKEVSVSAQLKLEWIIYYHTQPKSSVKQTATQFGITRKTLHKWLKRFKDKRLAGLEEISTTPLKTRKRQISLEHRVRIKSLRNKYPHYGKMKLVSLYFKQYQDSISSWKIQKIIESDNLYPDKAKALKRKKKLIHSRIQSRRRITNLVKANKVNYLWHVDTVILTISSGGYRYLLTAIDEVSKLAFARLYTTHTSRNAADFLERLNYLTQSKVLNLHHDNGSEFKKEFEEACELLNIPQWYSRPHTPKDNAVLERFNRTIQEEFVEALDVDPYLTDEFNLKLLDWLIEYNNVRPHQTLAYKTPLEYLDHYWLTNPQVSPMSSSSTKH